MASYLHEARKCTRGKAYLAATVMQVAALEAGLQAMCFIYPEEVKKSSVYAKKRFRGKRNKALEFSLYELITIVEELRWFPPNRTTWAGKRATVGGFSHQIRNVRNFVHPGVRAGERSDPLKFTKGLYGVVCASEPVVVFKHHSRKIPPSIPNPSCWHSRRVIIRFNFCTEKDASDRADHILPITESSH